MKSPAQMFSLEGRIALVTGSTRGLGWAMAQAIASAGATVVIHGRDATLARQRATQVNGDAIAVDLADEVSAARLVETVMARHGRLDIVANNAGIVRRNPLATHSTDDWNAVLALNLTIPFVLARQSLAAMQAQSWGRIINIGSVMSSIARADAASYVAAKHGLVGLTRAIAVESRDSGITCNLIAPGFIATELNADARNDARFTEHVIGRTPQRRWGTPEDICGAAVFLASDAAAFVTGAVLHVDGGLAASF